jgi:hypothetical protein
MSALEMKKSVVCTYAEELTILDPIILRIYNVKSLSLSSREQKCTLYDLITVSSKTMRSIITSWILIIFLSRSEVGVVRKN